MRNSTSGCICCYAWNMCVNQEFTSKRRFRHKIILETRMHSSRMHTTHSSDCRGGGSPPGTPLWDQVPPPRPDTPLGPGTPPARHPPRAGTPQEQAPPVDRHTPVNILPCPKLRLRAVKTNDWGSHRQLNETQNIEMKQIILNSWFHSCFLFHVIDNNLQILKKIDFYLKVFKEGIIFPSDQHVVFVCSKIISVFTINSFVGNFCLNIIIKCAPLS